MSSSDPGPGPEQLNPYGGPPPSQYPQSPYGQPPYGAPTPSGYPPYQPYQVAPPSDGLGVAAMIIGIVSLVLMCGYGIGLVGSPAALIMGKISMNRIDRSGGTLGGRGMALTGFILGIVGTVLLLLAIIAVVVIIVIAASGGFDDAGYSTY